MRVKHTQYIEEVSSQVEAAVEALDIDQVGSIMAATTAIMERDPSVKMELGRVFMRGVRRINGTRIALQKLDAATISDQAQSALGELRQARAPEAVIEKAQSKVAELARQEQIKEAQKKQSIQELVSRIDGQGNLHTAYKMISQRYRGLENEREVQEALNRLATRVAGQIEHQLQNAVREGNVQEVEAMWSKMEENTMMQKNEVFRGLMNTAFIRAFTRLNIMTQRGHATDAQRQALKKATAGERELAIQGLINDIGKMKTLEEIEKIVTDNSDLIAEDVGRTAKQVVDMFMYFTSEIRMRRASLQSEIKRILASDESETEKAEKVVAAITEAQAEGAKSLAAIAAPVKQSLFKTMLDSIQKNHFSSVLEAGKVAWDRRLSGARAEAIARSEGSVEFMPPEEQGALFTDMMEQFGVSLEGPERDRIREVTFGPRIGIGMHASVFTVVGAPDDLVSDMFRFSGLTGETVLKQVEQGRESDVEVADELVRRELILNEIAPYRMATSAVNNRLYVLQLKGQTVKDKLQALIKIGDIEGAKALLRKLVVHIDNIRGHGVGYRRSSSSTATIFDDVGSIRGRVVCFDFANLGEISKVGDTALARMVKDIDNLGFEVPQEVKAVLFKAREEELALKEQQMMDKLVQDTIRDAKVQGFDLPVEMATEIAHQKLDGFRGIVRPELTYEIYTSDGTGEKAITVSGKDYAGMQVLDLIEGSLELTPEQREVLLQQVRDEFGGVLPYEVGGAVIRASDGSITHRPSVKVVIHLDETGRTTKTGETDMVRSDDDAIMLWHTHPEASINYGKYYADALNMEVRKRHYDNGRYVPMFISELVRQRDDSIETVTKVLYAEFNGELNRQEMKIATVASNGSFTDVHTFNEINIARDVIPIPAVDVLGETLALKVNGEIVARSISRKVLEAGKKPASLITLEHVIREGASQDEMKDVTAMLKQRGMLSSNQLLVTHADIILAGGIEGTGFKETMAVDSFIKPVVLVNNEEQMAQMGEVLGDAAEKIVFVTLDMNAVSTAPGAQTLTDLIMEQIPEHITSGVKDSRSMAIALPQKYESAMVSDIKAKGQEAASYVTVGEHVNAVNKAAIYNIFNLLSRLTGKFEVVALEYEKDARMNLNRLLGGILNIRWIKNVAQELRGYLLALSETARSL